MPKMDGRAFRERQLADPALARIPVVVFSGDPTSTPLPGAGFVRKMDPDGLRLPGRMSSDALLERWRRP